MEKVDKLERLLKSGVVNKDQLRRKAWDKIIHMLKECIRKKDRVTFKESLKLSTTREHLFDLMKTAIYYNNTEVVLDIFTSGYDISEKPFVKPVEDESSRHESDKDYVLTPHIIYAACLGRM